MLHRISTVVTFCKRHTFMNCRSAEAECSARKFPKHSITLSAAGRLPELCFLLRADRSRFIRARTLSATLSNQRLTATIVRETWGDCFRKAARIIFSRSKNATLCSVFRQSARTATRDETFSSDRSFSRRIFRCRKISGSPSGLISICGSMPET